MELRKYQQDLVANVRQKIIDGNKKVLMVLPTGGGKSHTIADIAFRAVEKGHKVLALMHRRQLVTQLAGMFSDYGLDPAIIMSGEDPELGKQIQIATCQTYIRRLNLDAIEYNRYFIDASIVFIDEAHHALNKTYQTILENYKDKIVIGVTATPVLSSGVGMGKYFDAIVAPVGVGKLISENYLVPGIYYGPSEPDLSKLKTVMGDYEKKGLNKLMNEPKLIGDVVDNWVKYASGLQTMVFTVKVDHSKALRDAFIDRGIKAEHLDAYSDDEKRADTLRRFRDGDTRVLTNVGLYTEGTDIPEIQCIVLARPTKSLGLHLQMIGRGARPYPGKQNFMVLDHGGNIARLGFYEDEIEWSLSGKELGFKKKVKRVKEKKIRTCEQCTTLFTGKRCPMCGWEIKHFNRLIKAEEAELVKLDKREWKFSKLEKQQFYGMLEYYRRKKRYASGWVAHKYKEKFKCWPKGLKKRPPIIPNSEFYNWIKYQNIKWAKSKYNPRNMKAV